MQPGALFRFDAGLRVGGGHAARSLALASAFHRLGWRIAVATNPGGCESFPAAGDIAEVFESGDPTRAALNALGGTADLLVVDNYTLDFRYAEALGDAVGRILTLDDLADRALGGDFVLDPCPGRALSEFAGHQPAPADGLLGPDYACLRDEFWQTRMAALDLQYEPRSRLRLLLNFGAIDSKGLGLRVLDWLSPAADRIEATLYVTSQSPHLSALRERVKELDYPATIIADPDNIASLMVASDLAVCAGGSGSWERCALGLPSLIVQVAENQRETSEALHDAGAGLFIGTWDRPETPRRLIEALDRLARNPDDLRAMRHNAAMLCDGLGSRRVAAILNESLRTGQVPILRRMRAGDEATILNWQQAPETRRYFRTRAAPSAAEHAAWMTRRLTDAKVVDHILCDGTEPVGLIRLDPAENSACDWPACDWEVSILINPTRTGAGFGRHGLAMVSAMLPDSVLGAEIHPDNRASRRVFERAGFQQRSDTWYCRPPTFRKDEE